MTIGLVTTTGTVSSRLHQNRRRNMSAWPAWPVSCAWLWLPCSVVESGACEASCGSRCKSVIPAASKSRNKRTFVWLNRLFVPVLEAERARWPRIHMGRVRLTPWGRLASVRGPSSAPARSPSPNSLSIKGGEVAMQIALVLYPKFTVLDIIGPFQTLVDVPGHDVVFVGAEAGPVIDHTGRCPLVASASFAEVHSPDVVVGPGGNSKDFTGPVASWLRDVYPAATWVTSVCTGSIFLAAAGLLDGIDATTHWAWTEHLEKFGARYTEERVVERVKIITSLECRAAST